MKKQALTVLSMASLFVLLAVGSAYADPGSAKIRADIPFDFTVANKTHPAGTYAVEYTNPQGVPDAYWRRRNPTHVALVQHRARQIDRG